MKTDVSQPATVPCMGLGYSASHEWSASELSCLASPPGPKRQDRTVPGRIRLTLFWRTGGKEEGDLWHYRAGGDTAGALAASSGQLLNIPSSRIL